MGVLAVCGAVTVVPCIVSSLVSATSDVRACTQARKQLLDGTRPGKMEFLEFPTAPDEMASRVGRY